jgi:hypothetical protein
MALRTMAAKLKQKIPAAVQRVFASSRALVRSPSQSSPAVSSLLIDAIDWFPLLYGVISQIYSSLSSTAGISCMFLAVMEMGINITTR